uniref:Uncharacterized protein n=1 Tax=Arundo donax TaxID=35708 RepID=A0A0A8Y029_ARUDO
MNSFLRTPGQPLQSTSEFHISESLSDFGVSDSEFRYSEDLSQEADHLEFLPYQDDPVFLTGIEELESLSDLTDIG